MRVRHRWLLLSIFVAATLIVLAILGSRRTVHSGITISFLGYTNLPGVKVRSALFAVHTEHPASTSIGGPFVEVERLDFHTPDTMLTPNRLPTGQTSGGGYSWSFAVDEPLESGRWRASWLVFRNPLRMRLLQYGIGHRLLPRHWLTSLLLHQMARERNNCVTNSSIWLTNSP